MKRIVMTSLMTAAFVVSLPLISKADDILIKTMSYGTYGPAIVPNSGCPAEGPCAGAIYTCPEVTDALSPVNQTFIFINGICDDQGDSGLPACDGRYTSLAEECSGITDEITTLNGFVKTRDSSGAYIVCFDPTAGGDTCPPTADGIVIAEGSTHSHTSHVVDTEILTGVAQLSASGATPNYNDPDLKGQQSWKNSVGLETVVHSNAQINGSTCAATGPCGVASTGVGNQ